jgi:hypothetical protein
LGVLGKVTLLAGFTAPFSDTAPDSNHELNSAVVSELRQAPPASAGSVCSVSA